MNPLLLILILGIGYILAFGGLGLLRREGLSNRFALEGLAITILALVLGLSTGKPLNPVLFLVVIYLVTMRSRLLVDLGNLLASRGSLEMAERCYDLGLRLWPDAASRAIVRVNQGVLLLRQGQPEEAIQVLENVLAEGQDSHLGLKYEAAAHYNLGVAYRRAGRHAAATREFNQVLGLMPGSVFALHAEKALEAGRRKPGEEGKRSTEEPPGGESGR